MERGLERVGMLVLLLALASAPAPVPARDAALSSSLDYSLSASRDHPVTCKRGDLERHPGRSLAEVFGTDWPRQPEPAVAGAHERARLLKRPLVPQSARRALPVQGGLVVAAVLVAPDGTPVRVETLCATTGGYDTFVARLLMQAAYRPATVDGVPTTSVAIVVQRFPGYRS